MKGKKYITTTLPYVNADPHIGFAREILEADVWARFWRAQGEEVYFNTGTDEHGLKIFRKAEELGITPQTYCDEKVKAFQALKEILNISFDNFIRTTDAHHVKAAREFWKKCDASGDIYKKTYKVKYCVGCELEKTDSELENDCCPLHPNLKIEIIEEENYFFRFSKYQQPLLDLYQKNQEFVHPKKRMNEIRSFVERGLEDFSISRLKAKMPWGIEVPGDKEQVMYVWFDALVNYVSAAGWPASAKASAGKPAPHKATYGKEIMFDEWWPVVQLAGKDNLRQQAAMWQAMLLSAGIAPSKQVFINGFIESAGQKMSKSLGNMVSPSEMVEKYGVDGTRYLLLAFGNFGEDVDVSFEKFTEKYNAELANGLGNLVSRVIKLAEGMTPPSSSPLKGEENKEGIESLVNNMEFGQAIDLVWSKIAEDNKFIEENKPWELKKNDTKKFEEVMQRLLSDLSVIADLLIPFLPETAEKIRKALEVQKAEPLFQRIK